MANFGENYSPIIKKVVQHLNILVRTHFMAKTERLHNQNVDGKRIKPVFNVADDVARQVLAGIIELVSEDKQFRRVKQTPVVTGLKHCTNCGFEIAKHAKFCSSCGARQEIVSQAQHA